MNQLLERGPLPAQPTKRHFQSAPRRLYTRAEICDFYRISIRTFFDWKKAGKLPLFPIHIGRTVRYQAGPIDRHLAGR